MVDFIFGAEENAMSLKLINTERSEKEEFELSPSINKIIAESLAMEAEDAKEAGRLGFMARALIQATMPHSNPGHVSAWQRVNGNFALFMQSGFSQGNKTPVPVGLPYGCMPRLLLAWISSEVVKKRERTLILGHTLSEFLSKLGLSRQGGARGDITRLKEQQIRLFAASVSYVYQADGFSQREFFNIADSVKLWWEPKKPEEIKWRSELTLSQRFYDEILNNSAPIDLGAIKALKNSALALDIYCWLTYRMSYLKRITTIPWDALRLQFGSDYADTKQGRYEFKRKFITQLQKVLIIYVEARLQISDKGLILKPSRTHIRNKIEVIV